MDISRSSNPDPGHPTLKRGNKPHDTRRKQKRIVIDALSKGHPIRDVARLAGTSPRTISRWREKDPVFSARYVEAIEIGNGIIEQKVQEIAFDDSRDLNSARANLIMFTTKKRMPEYRENSPAVQINARVEFKAIDFTEVRKVLEDSGALEVIEGHATEDTDDQKSLPESSEVRPT